ncbi:MAG: sensor histidine kinase [Roseiarcus sp.]|jgi:signal transduction histidine kinase
MKIFNSLTARITLFVTVGYLLTQALWYPAILFLNDALPPDFAKLVFDPSDTKDVLGFERARRLLFDSLRRGEDGVAYIEPTPELWAYLRENPKVRFAAFESTCGGALRGSDPKLVEAVEAVGPCHTGKDGVPRMADDPNPKATTQLAAWATPVGPLPISLYGFTFHWVDLLYYLAMEFSYPDSRLYGPILLAGGVGAWLGVRHGLAPLKVAGRKVAGIDIDSLNQRIALHSVPNEVAPFVDAVNAALTRLDSGVATQRRFVANAAHELRTPITILCTHIDDPDTDEATFRRTVKRDALRIKAIVEQLLAAATISNQQEAIDEKVDLGKAILDMTSDYLPLAVENRHKIELDCTAATIIVRGNRRVIECIAANLIDNALRAEPEGGTVLLRVRPGATVEVVDHGEGVATEDREKIFEPFWRKDDSTPGTGLGLSIVKEMMDKQGGRVWVEETPGGGATFKLWFPIVEASA